jgi:hypothetical protein
LRRHGWFVSILAEVNFLFLNNRDGNGGLFLCRHCCV